MKKILILAMIAVFSVATISGCKDKNNSTSAVSNETEIQEENPVETETETEDSDTSGTESEDTKGENSEDSSDTSGALSFTTTDVSGASVTFSDLSQGKKVIMINFWEPWCGPCIGEMPDLEKLYQNYKEEGFLIIGASTTPNDDGSVTEGVESTGVTYPCINTPEDLYQFMTEYVPTTVILDSEGNVLTSEPLIGSNSYEGWEEIIKEYL